MDEQNKSMKERWAPPTAGGERGYATDPGFSSEYASDPEFGGTVDEDASEPRTAGIRDEIVQTRAEMSETIDAIQDRLRPGNIASRAAESVREATVGRVKEFAGDLTGRGKSRDRHRADDWRYESYGPPDGSRANGVVDRIRSNPMAAAMAAGSIAWLFLGNRRGAQRRGWSQDDRSDATYGFTGGGETFGDERSFDHPDGSRGFYGGGVRGGWRDSGSERVREAGASGREMADRAWDAASETGQRVRYAASNVQRRTRHFASDSPFAAGAIAAAVGLAIGFAIPETERENEMLGEARDSVIDRGKDAVRTAAERVQTAAGEVQRVAGDALQGIAGGAADGGSTQPQHGQASASQSPPQTAAPTSPTESAVPGMQAGSGGTGATPTQTRQTGRGKTR